MRTTHCDCNRNGIGDGAASELYTRWRPIWGQCLTVSCSCYCRERRPSVGRHFQQVSREDQEPSPTSVGHVMPTLALGGPALPLMVLPSAVRSPPLRSPDGPIATSGPKKRSLDAVCWTSVGHVMPTRVPGGPAFRQWSRLVPCVRHIAWSNGSDEPSRHPAVARCRKPTRTKRLWRRTRSGRSTRSE